LVDQLFALQKADVALRILTQELSELDHAANQLRSEIAEKREIERARKQEMSNIDRRRREIEATLKDEEEKTKNRRMRMARIRNEKELGALRHEIEMSKESTGTLEEELLQLLETGETKADELLTIEAELAAQEVALAEREKQLALRTAALRDDVEQRRGEREAIARELESSVLSRYELLFHRRGGIAVAEVLDGGCSGCGMRISPQMLTQLHRHRDATFCQMCQRILYVAPVVRPAAEGGN
jgi:predicted  nucleic acid-binding Zn-ribbon protein